MILIGLGIDFGIHYMAQYNQLSRTVPDRSAALACRGAAVKVLFLSQYYPPETNAPANRVSRMARHWVKQGAEVTVLTGFPNHPEGRVYPGFDASRPAYEDDEGVRVVRTPIYAAANNVVAEAANYEGELGQFKLGRRTSTDVLIAEGALAEANVEEIRAVVNYQIAQVDLAFATGNLLGASRVGW